AQISAAAAEERTSAAHSTTTKSKACGMPLAGASMTKASNPPEVAVIMRSTASDSTLKGVSTFALAAESTVIPSVVLGKAAATSVASIAPVPKEISGQRA